MKTTFFLIVVLLLVKCSSAQPYVWATNYSDAYNDRGNSIAIDNSGNVYIAGTTQTESISGPPWIFIAKYNSSGVQQWTATYTDFETANMTHGDVIAVDGSGNVYVGGSIWPGGYTHPIVLKYNCKGIFQWAAIYDVNGPISYFYDMKIDGSGNTYITGSAFVSGQLNILTVKYDPSGSQAWARNYLPSGYNFTGGNGLALDDFALGSPPNVYVTGTIATGGSGTEDYLTIKYDNNGTQQWVSTFNGIANGTDGALAICVDKAPTTNVYVTGRSWNGTDFDFATVKYEGLLGAQKWVSTYDGLGALDYGQYIVVESGANPSVYVSGDSYRPNSTLCDIATVKYNIKGVQQWVHRCYNGHSQDPYGMAIDGNNNVYVTGQWEDPSTWYGYYLTYELSPNEGSEIWSQIDYSYHGGGQAVCVTGVSLGIHTFVYVTGVINNVNNDIRTIEYCPACGSKANQFVNPDLVNKYQLDQNYPNPFNPVTNINFNLAAKSYVKLSVYNVLGEEIMNLINQELESGLHSVKFDANKYPSGIYFYKLTAGDFSDTKKMILVK